MSAKAENNVLTRQAVIEAAGVDVAARTIEVAFSSETPVDRGGYLEVLSHDPGDVDLSRLNSGGAFLLDHENGDYRSHVGAIIAGTARIDGDRIGRAKIKITKRKEGDDFLQDAVDGIRTKVSFGYSYSGQPKKFRTADGRDALRFPFAALEVSSVSVPADDTVGIGRSQQTHISKPMAENSTVIEDNKASAPNIEVIRETERKNAQQAERQRRSDLIKMADGVINIIPKARELAEKAIDAGDDTAAFQRALNDNFPKQQHIDAGGERDLGLSKKEKGEYSLARAINRLASRQNLDGLEKEASDAMARIVGRDPRGFFVPTDVMRGEAGGDLKRALVTNVFSAAGALVGTTLQSGSLIELLRNNMVTMQLGARSMSGLSGNQAIPIQSGGGTAYWLAESGTITESNQAVGQLSLTPHRLGASTSYSLQLLAQGSVDVEAFIRNDLMAVLALAKDKAVVVGSGASGEPLGICNSSNLSTSVTLANAGTMTYAEAVRFQTNVDTSNALMGNLGYLTTKTVKGGTKVTAKFSSTGTPVWEGDSVDGYRALASNQLTGVSATVLFGNWADVIVADWAGNEVIVDPYSLSLTGFVRVVMQQLCDNAIRHPKSFAQSTN